MTLPDEVREKVEQLQRDAEIRMVDGVEYLSRKESALRAAEIALEWAMETVCAGCGVPYPHKNGTWCETSIGGILFPSASITGQLVTHCARAEWLRKEKR